MADPTKSPMWAQLAAHYEILKTKKLSQIMEQEQDAVSARKICFDGLEVDLSRIHATSETMRLLLDLARAQDIEGWREKLFAGGMLNTTEHRAVLHTALRDPDAGPVEASGQPVRAPIKVLHKQMEDLSSQVREGRWLGQTGLPIRDVVNIGIGGSDLGPRLVVKALRPYADGPRVHFVANVDAADLMDVLEQLNPETTLFIVVSKTFTTQETLLNAKTAKAWLVDAIGQEAVARHFWAVSTNQKEVETFGIPAENMLPMWDWVGGRYSLWSAVGISITLAIGWPRFQALLAGAAVMDQHFRTAPLESNAPVLFAMLGVWYRNFWKTSAEAVLPYSERLRDLPRYLQQLNMESNGKAVTRDGAPISYETGPIIFGECGSVGQHSFHQWLHQAPQFVPAEFIGIYQDPKSPEDHHRILNAHMMAQIEAMRAGRKDPDPARTNPGNRPVSLLMMKELSPYNLGQLLALYEHKVFVQGIVWDVNSFDQFGVELGKKLAQELLQS